MRAALLLLGYISVVFGDSITAEENDRLQKECGFFNAATSSASLSRSMKTPNATRNEAPWAVSILFTFSGTINSTRSICSGTIISRRHIVTASHCVIERENTKNCCSGGKCKPADLHNMLLVASTVCSISQRRPQKCDATPLPRIKRAYSMRQYATSGCLPQSDILGDVAVIELEEDIEMTDTVRPACLNTVNSSAGDKLTMFGYGYDEYGLAGILRKHSTTVISNKECTKYMFKYLNGQTKRIDDICSKHSQGFACGGDSGSGQISYRGNRGYLTGILSYGLQCTRSLSSKKKMDFSSSTIIANRWIAAVTGVNPGFTLSEGEKKILEQEYFVYESK